MWLTRHIEHQNTLSWSLKLAKMVRPKLSADCSSIKSLICACLLGRMVGTQSGRAFYDLYCKFIVMSRLRWLGDRRPLVSSLVSWSVGAFQADTTATIGSSWGAVASFRLALPLPFVLISSPKKIKLMWTCHGVISTQTQFMLPERFNTSILM